MDKKELIKALEFLDDNYVVIISDDTGGWCNIDKVIQEDCQILITMEKYPVFSDN